MDAGHIDVAQSRISDLAEFRFALRKFLHFSEEAAARVGLTSQQHQLLLQIAGAPKGTITSVGFLAGRLALRHNSTVELCNRCADAGLVLRTNDPLNHRRVVLELTAEGNRILRHLSADHSRELTELGPQLIKTLRTFIS